MNCNHVVGFIERVQINALAVDNRVKLLRQSEMNPFLTNMDTSKFTLALWTFCPLCGSSILEFSTPISAQQAVVARSNELN